MIVRLALSVTLTFVAVNAQENAHSKKKIHPTGGLPTEVDVNSARAGIDKSLRLPRQRAE